MSRLSYHLRNRHLALFDLFLLPMAGLLAFVLRLDSGQLQTHVNGLLLYMSFAPLIKMPLFSLLGIYSRYWRYASVDELMLLAGAAIIGGLAQGALFLGGKALFPDLVPAIPRSIPLLDILVTGIVIAIPRFALRMWGQRMKRASKSLRGPVEPEHVLIAGAGEAGVLVLRELLANPQAGLIPVGFVDDDPQKYGALIQRVRVLGGREKIPELVRERHIEQVIIAMPSAPGTAIREIVQICEAAGVRTRIVPGIYELLSGKVSLKQIRDIQIEDLLRRKPIHTDTAEVAGLLRGKRVLVTGAGGSIGSELCRQILRFEPAELVLLGHGENSIFEIYHELLRTSARSAEEPGPKKPQSASANCKSQITPVIADIRFPERLQAVFRRHRPEIVFHAAAHKHVPLMETNIEDAVTNNVLGTQTLVETSIASGVQHFVLISTDKAVNPTSVMGATKRVAEMIVQDAAARTGRAYVAVRFGNVLGSRGSVVPFFQKQIAAGGPVTVTHPEMRRYFMTIPEAVQLVLQAATLGKGGEVFVLDMGEAVRIVDLAEDLIRLSGHEPGRDIEICFTGIRPGEKLYEELFDPSERHEQTRHEKIFVSVNGREPGWGHDLGRALDELAAAVARGDAESARGLLGTLVGGAIASHKEACVSGQAAESP
ncbi:MAG: polysaccharide biosynthesis protein [Anaerolineae bacterium]